MRRNTEAARRQSGFTLIELMIVCAIIAIVASMAIPNLLSARMTANETAAVATVRQLFAAQAQLKATGSIDVDFDGAGEYGYFGELSGSDPLRATAELLTPAVLSGAFANVQASRVNKSGYYFQLYLADGVGAGVAEDPTGGKAVATDVDADLCETAWCVYAWPMDRGTTGNRAFFGSQHGVILQCSNATANYSGTGTVPAPDAAFLAATQITGNIAANSIGQDGERWTPVQ